MEEITTELDGYLKKADMLRGVHSAVAKKNIYSGNAIRMHRSGKQPLKNEKQLKKLLNAYESEVLKALKRINNINVNN